jgi:hypothetical protein
MLAAVFIMSLDVSLKVTEKVSKQSSGIFVRENGQTKEISELEWYAKHPGQEPVKFVSDEKETNEVFDYNITHNLGEMASAAELYYPLWRPEEINITKASQLIVLLTKGLQSLLDKPDYYKTFNPENGWGNYEGLVEFVKSYLKACIDYPDAVVSVDR